MNLLAENGDLVADLLGMHDDLVVDILDDESLVVELLEDPSCLGQFFARLSRRVMACERSSAKQLEPLTDSLMSRCLAVSGS